MTLKAIRRMFLGGVAVATAALILPAIAQDKPAGKGGEKTQATAPKGAEVGKPAPEFTLKDTEGKEHKLSSYKGKVVVLEWTNHECPVVAGFHGASDFMLNTLNKFKGKDVVWLAVDSTGTCEQNKDAIKKWITDKKLTYPILLDASGATGHAFGASNTPHMFVIGKDGVLAYDGAPDDNAKKDKTTPRNYIEEAVNALLAGQTVSVATTQAYGCNVKYAK